MPSLRYLSFYRCPRLECFNEGIQRLTALRNLSFNNCKSLISLPQGMKHLTALEYLDITNCEKLKLMEGDDYPTRLRTLYIWELPQLVSLPQGLKGSANTLQFLDISGCENLGVLPEWLPDLNVLGRLVSQKRMFLVLKIAAAYQFSHNMQHRKSQPSLVFSLLLYCFNNIVVCI
ncbi:hypothetical protein CMV_019967 [Castanea mollissima]|uniref:Uncharacterized protein n=1 Tax=Castanea mollissima TaxID=60419 RepID=A0A8J4QRF0_9ROSI|nr:hypothetical protein CMV_019967 [Castanea mollissima]